MKKEIQEMAILGLRVSFLGVFFFAWGQVCSASDLRLFQTPSTGYQPQFQFHEKRLYFVWHEYDGPVRQVFTGEMNADGTGWKARMRTSGLFDKTFPQLQVSGDRIFYVRQQPDTGKNRQIWTMEMNLDGTGWREAQRTSTPFDKQFPQLQVVEKKIFYTWNETDGKHRQIWTAQMGTDGTNFRATQRTSSPFDKLEPQFHSLGEKIYFVWRESDGSHYQIWTATMNRDGTGWEAVKRTATPYDKHNPQFQVGEGKIFFAWHEADRSDFRRGRYQVWTAQMKRDGTGWQATQRTATPFDKYTPQLLLHRERVYYVWEESDGKYRQIWTAWQNQDGTGWEPRKRNQSPFGKYDPQFQIVGGKVYYVWHEDHGPTEPIWVAREILDCTKAFEPRIYPLAGLPSQPGFF
ncbi:MAG: hypothetical protein HXY45_03040 [Syntrophaceae bacterium]|nr:hypothetical protein [Syntrophaceae bacterium]